jgi:outer membrane protein
LPTLSLSGSYGRSKDDVDAEILNDDGSTTPFGYETPYLDNQSIGITLNVPIYQGGSVSAQTSQAKYNYVAASQAAEQTYRQTVQSVRSSFNNVKASISTIRALEQSVVSADSALKATEAGFDVGTRTIVDVLDSTRNLFDARRNLAGARYDFIQSVITLKQAAGTLTGEDVAMINRGLKPVTNNDNG